MPYPVRASVSGKRGKAAVGALLVGVLLSACGGGGEGKAADPKSSASRAGSAVPAESPKPSASMSAGPVQELADADGDGRPVEYYQEVLAALAPRCEEDVPELVNVVDATLKRLKEKGVDGETEFSVLQHLEHWVPAGRPATACAALAEEYVGSRDAT
ncbi:hypothetical protein AB0E75_24910 [Streptomyces griseoviridis]|uniref:Lipoprotein n=1 Tax=Streptomyces griseoviridis TaxID=45398 RepID=A0A918GVT3_STRGD|nr:hypothetical protein [Streptomyces niveoruber]GGS63848.1 hypothetical protein GCM10010238_61140 [Streptomyces niveoruber]